MKDLCCGPHGIPLARYMTNTYCSSYISHIAYHKAQKANLSQKEQERSVHLQRISRSSFETMVTRKVIFVPTEDRLHPVVKDELRKTKQRETANLGAKVIYYQ